VTELTPDEKAELRKAAEAATCCDQDSNYRYLLGRNSFAPLSLAKYVDAARPRIMLALLDENARLEAELDRIKARTPKYNETSTVPCPDCGKFSSIFTAGCGHCDYEDK